MHLVLALLAVVLVILGFVGFAFGGLPTVVCWVLAALCIGGAWKLRPAGQRRRENRMMGPRP
jgi:hypothetical protein